MENFEMWLEEFEENVKFGDVEKIKKSKAELKNFYCALLVKNEMLQEEIEDLKEKLED